MAAAISPDDLLPWAEVERLTGLSRSTWHRLRRRGEAPEPVPLSQRRKGCAEVTSWLGNVHLAPGSPQMTRMTEFASRRGQRCRARTPHPGQNRSVMNCCVCATAAERAEAAADTDEAAGLTPLIGTDKQVDWASQVAAKGWA